MRNIIRAFFRKKPVCKITNGEDCFELRLSNAWCLTHTVMRCLNKAHLYKESERWFNFASHLEESNKQISREKRLSGRDLFLILFREAQKYVEIR